MKKPPILVLVLVLAASGGGLMYTALKGPEDKDTIFVSGTVEATEAELGFQVAGKLERVLAQEGDEVRPGAELAALEQTELEAEREVARAQIASAQALLSEYVAGSRREEIARARASLAVAEQRQKSAKQDLERLRGLAQQSVISRQAFDHQQTEADVADGEVNQATEELRLLEAGTRVERITGQRATLAQANAALGRIDAQLSQTTIKAPFSGTVTIRHREPGEAVSAGAPVLTLQNLENRWVRIYVPGDEVGRLSLGQCASIASDGFAERRYGGRVSYISRIAEFTPRNVQSTKDRVRLVYEVRVRIVGDEAIDLKPGLPGDVTFRADSQVACATTRDATLGAR
jgi:HlyD family secretion protein